MITRRKAPRKSTRSQKGVTTYEVVDGPGPPQLVVSTTFAVKLVKEEIVRGVKVPPGTFRSPKATVTGVAMYQSPRSPRYLVSRYTDHATATGRGNPTRSFVYWNTTDNKAEAVAMFQDLVSTT